MKDLELRLAINNERVRAISLIDSLGMCESKADLNVLVGEFVMLVANLRMLHSQRISIGDFESLKD